MVKSELALKPTAAALVVIDFLRLIDRDDRSLRRLGFLGAHRTYVKCRNERPHRFIAKTSLAIHFSSQKASSLLLNFSRVLGVPTVLSPPLVSMKAEFFEEIAGVFGTMSI